MQNFNQSPAKMDIASELQFDAVQTKHRHSNNESLEGDSIFAQDEIDMSAFGQMKQNLLLNNMQTSQPQQISRYNDFSKIASPTRGGLK